MTSHETIRRDLNASTAAIAGHLSRYAKLAAQASTSYSSSGVLQEDVGRRKAELEGELNGALEAFGAQIEGLQTFQATAHPPPSTSAVHALERHREVLLEYERDFARTKASLREAEQRANLLGSVRDEISAFKSNSHSSATDALLSERGHIDSSHSMTDQLLGQAYETRAEFNRQRQGLQGINARMNGVIAQVPALNSVLGMISSRRQRDSLIVGGVLASCTVVLCYVFIL